MRDPLSSPEERTGGGSSTATSHVRRGNLDPKHKLSVKAMKGLERLAKTSGPSQPSLEAARQRIQRSETSFQQQLAKGQFDDARTRRSDGWPNVASGAVRDRFDRGFRYAMSVHCDRRARIQELLHTLMEWGSHLDNVAARLKTMNDTQIEAFIESIEPNILSGDRRKLARELLVRRRNIILEEVAKDA